MPAACPKCSGPLGSSFRFGHLHFRITCTGCGARLQGNWVVYLLVVLCAIMSLSGLIVFALLRETSIFLAGAAAGTVIGLWVEVFRHATLRWARFTEDPD